MNKKMSFIDNESMVDQFSNQSPVSDDGGSGSGGSGSGSSGSGSPSGLSDIGNYQSFITLPEGFGSVSVSCYVSASAEYMSSTSSGKPIYQLKEVTIEAVIYGKTTVNTEVDKEGNSIQTIYKSSAAAFKSEGSLGTGLQVYKTPVIEIDLVKEIKKNEELQSKEETKYEQSYNCRYRISLSESELKVDVEDFN